MAYDRYVPEFTDKDGQIYGVMDTEAREAVASLNSALNNSEYSIHESGAFYISKEFVVNGSWASRVITFYQNRVCTSKLLKVKKGDTINIQANGWYWAFGVYEDGKSSSSGFTNWQSESGTYTIMYDGGLFMQFKKTSGGNENISPSDFACVIYLYSGTIIENKNNIELIKKQILISDSCYPIEEYRYPIVKLSTGISIQSICRDSSNNLYYICTSDGTGNNKFFKSTSPMIDEATDAFSIYGGHGNDCTFNTNDGYIYMVTGRDGNDNPEGTNPANMVIAINPSTQSIVTTYTLQECTYCDSIDYHAGVFYVRDGGIIYLYNSSFVYQNKRIIIDYEIVQKYMNDIFTRQGIIVNDDFIILSSVKTSDFGSGALIFFTLDGELVKVVRYEGTPNEEAEGLCFDENGGIFVISNFRYYVVRYLISYSAPKQVNVNYFAINSNDVLNNKYALGTYYSPNAATTATLGNLPALSNNAGFTMEVKMQANNNIRQTILLNGSTPHEYTRIYELASNRWLPWQEVLFKSE